MYNTYYLVLFLYAFSKYSSLWNYEKWIMDEKHKRRYNDRPILKPESFVTSPVIVRRSKMKPSKRFKGWKGSR